MLREQLLSAAAAEREKRRGQAQDRAAKRAREAVVEAGRVFGEPTGEEERDPVYSGTRAVIRPPEGMAIRVTRERDGRIDLTVDGVPFAFVPGAQGRYELRSVLVCPDCGEQHLGMHLYPQRGGTRDYSMAQLGEEIRTQRARYGHHCYESAVAAVLSAARLGADRQSGIGVHEILRRAMRQVAA